MRILGLALATLAVIVAGSVIAGTFHWRSVTRDLRAELEAARQPVNPAPVDFQELDSLPPPVQRYFRLALTEGQPRLSGARVRHEGTFNMGEDVDRWKPFSSDQQVITSRPGFDWNARVDVAPGLHARVHDAYVAGEGLLRASLLGLVPLVNLRGDGVVAEGELMRFLGEATWYPTALLPGPGVRWDAVDDRSATVTLTDGSNSVTLLVAFNEQGLVESVRSESRGRMVGDSIVPTPWEGRFWNYEDRDGMKVPIEGEVAWVLPAGAKPYWRGRITELVYEFAR